MYKILIILLVIVIMHYYTEKFSNEKSTFVELNGDNLQLIYDRPGIYKGSFNAKVKSYKIYSGPNRVILQRLEAHSGMTSRVSDASYQQPNAPIIVTVEPNQTISGWVDAPTHKIMLTIESVKK